MPTIAPAAAVIHAHRMMIGLGLGLGFPSTFQRPQSVTEKVAKKHVAAVEKFTDVKGHQLLGSTSLDDRAADDDLLAALHLPDDHRERIVQAHDVPLRLVRALLADPTRLYQVTPRKFEEIVAEIVASLGFTDVLLTAGSKDGGRDIIASQLIHGLPLTFYFECKRYAPHRTVDLQTVRALLGTFAHNDRDVNKAVLVTTATFEPGARKLIAEEVRLGGRDYDELVGWMHDAWAPRLGRCVPTHV